MDDELISKKELLELTGISYGQLYRWKRKNLIPEEWFVRKSTFTGQETFFLKEKILARIDKILNMKEGLSLDDLADVFSPNPAETYLTKRQVIEQNIVSNVVLNLYADMYGEVDGFHFDQLLDMFAIDRMLRTGEIGLEEGRMALQTLSLHVPKLQGKNADVLLIRKLGVAACLLITSPNDLYADNGVKVVIRLPLSGCIEELKLRLP